MKYYHLVGFSAVLFLLQWGCENLLGLTYTKEANLFFVSCQIMALSIYSLFFCVYFIASKKQRTSKKIAAVVKMDQDIKKFKKAS
ncbi:hypothetical protein [Enterococcus canintestini]|uniref:hypothetical protein n=1 Tax=Enterococcus canintestini TaxID=317010 RepID=UPI00288C79FD|nr:hypothetical protein [Enterococcus canintestini]MDT2739392.1 hypothetical protein [Enterococcus canintestini]